MAFCFSAFELQLKYAYWCNHFATTSAILVILGQDSLEAEKLMGMEKAGIEEPFQNNMEIRRMQVQYINFTLVLSGPLEHELLP